MELRPLKPKKSPKVKKIVYIDEASLLDKSDLLEQETIEWLTEFFDVYIVRADGFIHLLRGDYLISPIQHEPMFRGECVCFRLKGSQDTDSPQTDWQRVKAFFSDIVEKGENVDDGVSDETALAMFRSQLRYDDDNC